MWVRMAQWSGEALGLLLLWFLTAGLMAIRCWVPAPSAAQSRARQHPAGRHSPSPCLCCVLLYGSWLPFLADCCTDWSEPLPSANTRRALWNKVIISLQLITRRDPGAPKALCSAVCCGSEDEPGITCNALRPSPQMASMRHLAASRQAGALLPLLPILLTWECHATSHSVGFPSTEPTAKLLWLVHRAHPQHHREGLGKQREQKKPFAENMQANELHPSSLAPLI